MRGGEREFLSSLPLGGVLQCAGCERGKAKGSARAALTRWRQAW